jgi:hypothetical protein
MRKLLLVLMVIALVVPAAAPRARAMSCWDIMSAVGYSSTMWSLCMLEIWTQSGQPQVPDPGGGSSGGWEG